MISPAWECGNWTTLGAAQVCWRVVLGGVGKGGGSTSISSEELELTLPLVTGSSQLGVTLLIKMSLSSSLLSLMSLEMLVAGRVAKGDTGRGRGCGVGEFGWDEMVGEVGNGGVCDLGSCFQRTQTDCKQVECHFFAMC